MLEKTTMIRIAICKTGLPIVFYHSLVSLKVQSQSIEGDAGVQRSGLVIGRMEWMARTSVHLAVIVDDTTSHVVRPTPREDTRWGLLRLKVLGVSV